MQITEDTMWERLIFLKTETIEGRVQGEIVWPVDDVAFVVPADGMPCAGSIKRGCDGMWSALPSYSLRPLPTIFYDPRDAAIALLAVARGKHCE